MPHGAEFEAVHDYEAEKERIATELQRLSDAVANLATRLSALETRLTGTAEESST